MKELKNYNIKENENNENLQPTFIEVRESTSDDEISISISTIVIGIVLGISVVIALLLTTNLTVGSIGLKLMQILAPLSILYSITKEILIVVFLFTGIMFFIKRK